jgi:hypothetical protein
MLPFAPLQSGYGSLFHTAGGQSLFHKWFVYGDSMVPQDKYHKVMFAACFMDTRPAKNFISAHWLLHRMPHCIPPVLPCVAPFI